MGNQGQKLDALGHVELGEGTIAALATGRQTWGTTRFLGLLGHRAATAAARATVAHDTAREAAAKVAGLEAAVSELAKGSGVDPALIERVVAEATAKALTDLRIVSSREDEDDRAATRDAEIADESAEKVDA